MYRISYAKKTSHNAVKNKGLPLSEKTSKKMITDIQSYSFMKRRQDFSCSVSRLIRYKPAERWLRSISTEASMVLQLPVISSVPLILHTVNFICDTETPETISLSFTGFGYRLKRVADRLLTLLRSPTTTYLVLYAVLPEASCAFHISG